MFLSTVRKYYAQIAFVVLAIVFSVHLVGCQSAQTITQQYDAQGNPITTYDADGNPYIPAAQRELLDRIEFEGDEYGCVQIIGEIDLNTSLLFSSTAQIILKKNKNPPDGGDPPEC